MAINTVGSWGRLGQWEHEVQTLYSKNPIHAQLQQDHKGLAYGMGRSYGDVCLNPNGVLWKTTALDHFISFDPKTGRLVCEAGVLLRDIQQLFIPRGWILPVTPGTQMVTVGGAIANDIHGKNHHHAGSFGHHVQRIKLIRTDGQIIECGPHLLPQWFAATVGGVGLTGIILEAEIQLVPVTSSWLNTETLPYTNLREFFQLAKESENDWQYTVSWVDCLAKGTMRGLFTRANHCAQENPSSPRKQRTIPFTPPMSLVNAPSVRLFNTLYYQLNKNQLGIKKIYYESFFYPLDSLLHWNKIYGPKGFFQYQTVISPEASADAIQAMLNEIANSNLGSFLSVLKTFGNKQSVGMLSFPKPGVTLALDFPNKGLATQKLFERLDAIVCEAHGRNYLAKDARMAKDLFVAGYSRLNEFLHYRDPGISSAMSRRLLGD